MRLVSYLDGGSQALGVLTGDRIAAATSLGGPATMAQLLASGPEMLARLRAAPPSGTDVALDQVTLLAPVPEPANVVCVGRNYREHAAEEGLEPPQRPELFLKHTSAVTGPGTEIRWDPDYTRQVDFEVELAAVIGTAARHVPVARALEYVAGYTCLNDVSARDLQFGDAQWARGKSLETFCPMGPALVTADEIGEPQSLEVRSLLDGTVMQQANTADMWYSVAEVIAHCSAAFTLRPGDVIATGTPGGVGIFRDPPELLDDGRDITVEIEGIGRLVNRCRTSKNP